MTDVRAGGVTPEMNDEMKAKLAASEARGDVAPSSPTAYSLPRRGR